MPLPRRTRPARAEVCWSIGGFMGLTAVLVLAMEIRYPHWTDREYAARRELVLDRVAERPDRPVLAVLGSSRVGTGFAPELLGDLRDPAGRPVCAFNFSHQGAGPRLNWLQFRRLLRDDVRPTWVLLELLPAHLQSEEPFFADLSLTDVAWLNPYWADARLPWRMVKNRLDAPSRYRRAALDTVAPTFATGKAVTLGPYGGDDGWERPHHLSDSTRAGIQETIRKQYCERMADLRIDPAQDRVLRATLSLCREHDIAVAMVIFPENRTFRSWYGPAVEDRIQTYLLGLHAEFGVRTFDTRDWMADDAFNDPHHLTADGARAYTIRLGREVIGPLLAGTGSTLIVGGKLGN